MVQREISAVFEGRQNEVKSPKTGEATPTKIGLHAYSINLYLHNFFEPILFLIPMDYTMVGRETLAILKATEKGTKSPKPERSRLPKLVCMHFTSTSICIKFLS